MKLNILHEGWEPDDPEAWKGEPEPVPGEELEDIPPEEQKWEKVPENDPDYDRIIRRYEELDKKREEIRRRREEMRRRREERGLDP